MKWILTLLLITQVAVAGDIRVSIIDTGLDLKDPRFSKYLCSTGHNDYTGNGIQDDHGHGTHVTGLITKYAGDKGYCLVILKYFQTEMVPEKERIAAYTKALYETVLNGSIFANYSGGGPEIIKAEALIIEKYKNITFVVAAGNENSDIATKPYFPASYPFLNVISVGSLRSDKPTKSKYSNFGVMVDAWEVGDNVLSTCRNKTDCLMSGTSMATAIHMGKMIKAYVDSHK